MGSRAIISVLLVVPLVFVACGSSDGASTPNRCPGFQTLSVCTPAPGAACVHNDPAGGCALNALPSGLSCSDTAQCSLLILPCPDEVATWAGGGLVDAYICTCVGSRWSCDDCYPGQSTCTAAPLLDAATGSDVDAMSVPDAAQIMDAGEAEVTDASFCQQSLDAWCAMPNAGCIRDWASTALPGGPGCGGWSASVCGAYDVLSVRFIDSGQDDYYDKTTGQLVAIVYTGNVEVCVGGPPDFMLPSACSPSMSRCDLGEGGTDAPTDTMDSGAE